jgi:pimeloyl-ACP methyl ester carboxylesterase
MYHSAGTAPKSLLCSDLKALEQITVTVLFMLGSASPAFFRQTTETLPARLSNAHVVVLEGQQHSAMLTTPDFFANEIIRFLKQ